MRAREQLRQNRIAFACDRQSIAARDFAQAIAYARLPARDPAP
jgi:hypothetical protein